VSLLTGILFGLVPALQSTRPQLAGTLKRGRSIAGEIGGHPQALVVAQRGAFAPAAVGAGLFIRIAKTSGSIPDSRRQPDRVRDRSHHHGYKPERSLDFLSPAS